jgi:hypothetical protein
VPKYLVKIVEKPLSDSYSSELKPTKTIPEKNSIIGLVLKDAIVNVHKPSTNY